LARVSTDTPQRSEIASARKDAPHMSPNWDVRRDLIAGVQAREVRNVVTSNGITTELFRRDWGIVDYEIPQIIHVALRGGAVSAWHMHQQKTDHLFVVGGHLRIVLYDERTDSPTHGQVDVFHLSPARPQLLVVPPSVWHGVQNLSNDTSTFVNFFDREYDYEDPDDWRLPPDTTEIPYRF
jgi:dTDP-4-dehydrorhamnose 3,5-epimerase